MEQKVISQWLAVTSKDLRYKNGFKNPPIFKHLNIQHTYFLFLPQLGVVTGGPSQAIGVTLKSVAR